jgi:DNA-binding transcriptional MerR regulator
MATVSTLVNLFGVSKHTIRTWSKEFADHLSRGANPSLGERRQYNDGDIQVFALIAHLRAQNAQYKDIQVALARGERMELVPTKQEIAVLGQTFSGGAVAPTAMTGFAPVELIESFAQRLTAQFQDQINQLRDEIVRLERQNMYFRDKLDQAQATMAAEQKVWVESAKKIARMEAELESAALNAELLKEERSARMNAQNRLAAAQAKAEKLEALMETAQEQKGRRFGLR